MDQLFQRKWVGCLGLYVVLAFALVLAGPLVAYGDAIAQQQCAPVEVGEWDCDMISFSEAVKCATPILPESLEPVWQTFQSEQESLEYLRGKYKDFGNALTLGRWLSCQGFGISVSRDETTAIIPDRPRLGSFWANFNRKKFEPYPLPWFNPLSWTSFYDYQAFVFQFDRTGNLVGLSVIEPL